LIAVEGIDQAGKGTQAKLLAATVRKRGVRVSLWAFPDYRTPVGRLIKAYLADTTRLDLHSVHLLYAANKWEVAEKLRERIRRGEIVIVNRYTPSNLAYGLAHGLQERWLESLEEGLPKPDMVVVLDIPPIASLRRKRIGRDIHEADLTYLTKVRGAYKRLAKKYGWIIADGMGDPETVHRLIWAKVATTLPAARQRKVRLPLPA